VPIFGELLNMEIGKMREHLGYKDIYYYDENNYSRAVFYRFEKNTLYKPYPLSNLDPNLKVSAKDIKIYYNIDIIETDTFCQSYNGKFNKYSSEETTGYGFDTNTVNDPCTQRSLALFDPKTMSLLVFDNPETARLYKTKKVYGEEILDNGIILDNKEIPLTPDAFGNIAIKEILSGTEVLRNNIETARNEFKQKLLQQSIVSKNYDKIFGSG